MTVLKTTKQEAETLGGSKKWNWVEASVWTERMLAALENGVKGGKWFSLIDKVISPLTLHVAWQKVAANKGAAGVDKISIERFKANQNRYLTEMEEELRTGRFQPQPVNRVYIPKGKGQRRPLGIPTVKDRIVQTALKMVMEPIFENEFLDMSFGFRPGRGCKGALREVDMLIKSGFTWVVDADIKGYFDAIPHEKLMDRVKDKISDGKVLGLVEGFLKQDIMENLERWTPTGGTPQGAVISPLLANIYLHPLDDLITRKGHKMVRYADDFVILCRNQEEADSILSAVRKWTKTNGLELHPDKTHLGDCVEPGQGFDFLGYRFEAGKRYIRKKSLSALKDKLRLMTKRTRGDSITVIIRDLNPMLKGWFEYFKHANHWIFKILDGFIRRRLRAILRKQLRKPGFGRCLSDHRRWPNAFFAKHRLFTMHEAWVIASQSR